MLFRSLSVIFTVLCISGLIVWWPGIDRWKRSLLIDPRSGWKRINWDLHSAVGFWTFGLVFMWAVTGIFVVWPTPFERQLHKVMPLRQYQVPEDVPDEPRAQVTMPVVAQVTPLPAPPDAQGGVSKGGFGKGGFGKGRGKRAPIVLTAGDKVVRWSYYLHFGNFAGNKTKALWVVLGLLPALLFVTGTIMWWNRVLSPAARRSKRAAAANATGV